MRLILEFGLLNVHTKQGDIQFLNQEVFTFFPSPGKSSTVQITIDIREMPGKSLD